MGMYPCASAALLAILAVAVPVRAAEEPTPGRVRAAVARSLPLLQKGAAGYVAKRECFSCHNQALPVLAFRTARERGFDVDDAEVERQARHTAAFLTRNRDGYRKGRGQGGQVDTAGYALLTLEVAGWKPDATTAAVTEYLLQRDQDRDHWRVTSHRPPSEASSFTTTFLALRGLRAFGTPAQKERIASRLEKARRWLLATPARDTEDRVFRLWALRLAGAPEEAIRSAARQLAETQRKDGGWGQTDDRDSDAYATGTALVALSEASGLAVTDPAYRRGMRYLVETQRPDGSWLVRSRSRPFQTYFESGFPHGKDQFISSAATGWAATALALACGPAGTAAPGSE